MTIVISIDPNGFLARGDYKVVPNMQVPEPVNIKVENNYKGWNFHKNYALFQYGEAEIYKVELSKAGMCRVPKQVLGEPYFYISLRGVDPNGRVGSTNQIKVPCEIRNRLDDK